VGRGLNLSARELINQCQYSIQDAAESVIYWNITDSVGLVGRGLKLSARELVSIRAIVTVYFAI